MSIANDRILQRAPWGWGRDGGEVAEASGEALASDDSLVVAAILENRDPASQWQVLWNRHGQRSFRIAWRVLRDAGEVEAAVNAAWARAAARLDRSVACFGAWIGAIVRNEALDTLRRRRAHAGRETPLEPWHRSPLASSDPERAAIARDTVRRILACQALSPDERRALHLRYLGGHTHEEIGRIMGRPTDTASVILHRAVAKLRTHPRIEDLLIPLAWLALALTRQGGC